MFGFYSFLLDLIIFFSLLFCLSFCLTLTCFFLSLFVHVLEMKDIPPVTIAKFFIMIGYITFSVFLDQMKYSPVLRGQLDCIDTK